MRQERERNSIPERARLFRDSSYRRRYGIGIDEYESKFREQNGACAVCKKQNTDWKCLAVDHDHATGKVRGLLCRPCNMALGFIHDEIETAESMVSYIKKWSKEISFVG